MKVLFTSTGTTGHLHPSMPYAFATRDAGHDVAFATPPVAVPIVEALGFPAFAVGLDRGPNEALRLAGVSDEGLTVEEQLRLINRYWTLGD